MDVRHINIAHCREALHPRNAKLVLRDSLTDIPLSDIEEVNVEWGPFSTADKLEMYKYFLRYFTWPTNAAQAQSPKSYIGEDAAEQTDPSFEVEHQPFYGRWRMAYVRFRKQELRENEFEYYIVLTLRKGFLQSFTWDEVLIQASHTSPGNTDADNRNAIVDPDSDEVLSNTASDTPVEAITLRLANIDPARSHDIAKTINASVTGSLTVEERTIGSGWSFLVADPQRQQDGSATITFVISKSQFTCNGFQNNNTAQELRIGYLFEVPEVLAQSIMDAWDDGQNRSATASRNAESGLMNIVLTSFAGVANMTTPWIQISCDTYERYHFAWGYTEDEVYDSDAGTGFIADHDSAIGTEEDGKIIRSRQVRVQTRGDGVFDATITERSWANSGENASADFTITLPVGTKIQRLTDYGYNFSLDNMTAIKTTYDTTVAAVGKTVDFQVTREDDCSFDYVAVITTVTEIDSEQQSKQPDAEVGLGNVVQAISHATAAEIGVALAAYTPGIGKQLRVALESRDNETYDVTFYEVTAQTPEHTGAVTIGDKGLGISVASGHNATAAEVTTAIGNFTSGARKRLILDMRGADDGGWDYFIRQDEVKETADASVETTGTDGIGTKMRYGRNQDSAPAITKSRLKRLSGGVSANDDKTVNHQITEETLVETDKTIQAGSKGEHVDVRAIQNGDPTLLDADVYPTGKGATVLVEARFDDAGNLIGFKRSGQKVEQNETLKGGTYLNATEIKKAVGDVGADELDASGTVAEGVSVMWRGTLYPDGSIDWDRILDTAAEKSVGSINLANLEPRMDRYGYSDVAEVFRNVYAANIGNYDVDIAGDEYGYIERLSMNDDGTLNGVKIVRTYNASSYQMANTNAEPEDITSWVRKEIVWVKGSDGLYTDYMKIAWTIKEAWDSDYGDAITFAASGFSTGPKYVTISGRGYWWTLVVTSITVTDSAGVNIFGGAITP